jgi:hypothetical protein
MRRIIAIPIPEVSLPRKNVNKPYKIEFLRVHKGSPNGQFLGGNSKKS